MHHHCIWDAAQPRLLHRRHLRPVVPRVRHRAPAPGSCRRRRRCSSSPRPCAARSSACSRSRPSASTSRTTAAVGDVPRLAAPAARPARRDGRARALDVATAPDRHAALMRGLEAIHLKSLRAHGVDAVRRAHPRAARARPRAERAGHRHLARPDRSRTSCNDVRFDFTGRGRRRHRRRATASARPARACSRPAARAVALWDVDARAGAGARRRARASGRRARQRFALRRRAQRPRSTPRSRPRSPPSAASTSWSTTPASSAPPTSSTSAEADWDAVIDVNLKGAFLVGQAVARAMAQDRRRRDRQHELGQRRDRDPRASPATTRARAASTS